MSDEAALLQAVTERPTDDLPRLVYADWLEEQGQSVRAEFIRLQCEIAKLQAGPVAEVYRNVPLFKRQQDILDYHQEELLGPEFDSIGPFQPVFERGFLAEVTVKAEQLEESPHWLAGLLPPPKVTVTGLAERLDSFLQSPVPFDRINSVMMQSEANYFPLRLNERQTAAFAQASRWDRLHSLDLAGCGIGDASLMQLCTGERFPELIDLDLSDNLITDFGVLELLGSGIARNLKRLVLGGNPISDVGAFELADRLGWSGRLRYLNLRFTNITSPGQSALLARFPGKVDLF